MSPVKKEEADDDAHNETNTGDHEEEAESTSELLSQLITALGTGVRAVQGLPSDHDDFEFQSTFPEFSELLQETHQELLDTLLLALDEDGTLLSASTELDDPLLWETCADACDVLVEQVESHLRESSTLTDLAQVARQKAHSSFGKLISGIVEMPKPQVVHELYSNLPYDFERTTPFVPPITEKFHAVVPLDLTLKPGHGLDTRFGELRGKNNSTTDNLMAPTHHVPHVYETEIQQLAYAPWQLEPPVNKPPKIVQVDDNKLQATWIETASELQHVVETILDNQDIREVALDLEAHSFRSFQGFICLIQLSYKDPNDDSLNHNYLIDPFPLWNDLNSLLGPILAHPEIVKIFHGADSDVQWLQRDFGLYIVNLFDTGRAARALKFSSAGYAYLLKHYVDIAADKTHQLSDWRQRPLPDDMKQYAIMDTHYLLDVYEHLKYDLSKAPDTSIREVLDISKQVSLIRYATEPFRPDRYTTLIRTRRGSRVQTDLSAKQERVLKGLFDWRDQVARNCDESLWYVCRNDALIRMALACPTNLSTLQGLFHPMLPLVLRYAKDIVSIIHKASHHDPSKRDDAMNQSAVTKTPAKSPVGAPSSAFSKPTIAVIGTVEDADEMHRERTLMSPVLGTEALYKQAGWTTPQHGGVGPDFQVVEPITTTDDGDDDDIGMGGQTKPRRVLGVHQANQSYRTRHFTPHSLRLADQDIDGVEESGSSSGNLTERGMIGMDHGRIASGMGVAKAARDHSRSANQTPTIEEDAEMAHHTATQIRSTMSHDAEMMGLMPAPADLVDEDDFADRARPADTEEELELEKGDGEEEFVIPRSMREIYKISNRNRKNKKASSPLPTERSGTPASEKEMRALAEAEEILKARGLDGKAYFDDIPGSPKRQRTKSVGNASQSSEEAGGGTESGSQSREDDIQLMKEVGWVKDKEEVENMLKQRPSGDVDEGGDSDDDDQRPPKPVFEYSKVGQIGAFNASQTVNPFFTGAATVGGHLTQQFGKMPKKKQNNNNSGNNSGHKKQQSRRQHERPEKQDGKAQAFRKR